MIGNMTYLFLIVMLLAGCRLKFKATVEVVPAYVDLVTTAVKAATTQVGEVKAVLQENTQLLLQIKDIIENPPTGGAEAQETPSSPKTLAPPVIILYVSSIPGCAPCQMLKNDDAAGKFAEAGFEVQYVDDPAWRGGYPVIRWVDSEGNWKGSMYKDRKGRYVSAGYGPGTIAELTRLVQ